MDKPPKAKITAAEFEPEPDPARLEACRAYARAMNTLDPSHLEPSLSPDDFTYSSQWVLENLRGKAAYLDYLKGKFETIKEANAPVWAEIGYTKAFGAGDCVLIAQKEHTNLVATVLIEMREGQIKKINMCGIPSPYECQRTGEYPC